jgi:Lung seven transmembrane receptor
MMKPETFTSRSDDTGQYDEKETICSIQNVEAKLCEQDQLGSFILAVNATEKSKQPLLSHAIHLQKPDAINYPISKTGFYCVSTYAFSDTDYSAIVTFGNSYGELPAAQIAKLPFYGGLTITYAVLGAFWAFLYFQHRSDILPVQNYITATIIFLIVEQLMTWGFYDYQNRNGNNALNKALMVLVAILNAGRNSLSFFLLLIVCMGYGVVKPSLGKTMIYVRFLAIAHFFFGVIYAVASLSVTPDSAGPLVLLVILPLSATLTAFYIWTLNSLSATMKDLIDRKQKTKAMMYKKLWWCILGSIMVIFGFFFVNSFAFAGRSEANFVPEHWQTRWFILDGWLNLVYLFDIAFVAYLWRPTANNRRFAMSDEVSAINDSEILSRIDSISS